MKLVMPNQPRIQEYVTSEELEIIQCLRLLPEEMQAAMVSFIASCIKAHHRKPVKPDKFRLVSKS